MKTMTTFAIAVALGAAWSVAPAMAQTTTTTTPPPAVEKKDTLGDKVERGVDKTKEKAGDLKDKVVDTTKKAKDKVVDTTKKTKDKVVDKTDSATDKAADKTDRAVDKAADKTEKVKDKLAAKTDRASVRSYQQALKDKGHDPGPIDGIHGPRTTAAVREYQKKEGLTVTGRLDDDSLGRLSGTGTVRTGSDGTAPASPSASPSTGTAPATPQIPAKQTR
jgi:peptidoglycan hydrolase-like protein with peptidoglycan-binding domain